MKDKIRIVYTGRVTLSGNKAGYGYESHDGKRELYFGRKVHPVQQIGQVFEMETEGTSYVFPGKFIECVKDKDLIARWVAQDRAWYDDRELSRKIKKKMPTSYDEAIDKLRWIRNGLSPGKKKLFIMRVMLDLEK